MSERDIRKRSGFVLRMMMVLALSCAFLFTALVVLENKEIAKIIPHSPFRSLSLFFGYIVGILSYNYLSAHRGRNHMGWKVEACLMLAVITVFAAFYFTFAFPSQVEETSDFAFGLFERTSYDSEPNWAVAWLSLGALLPLGYSLFKLSKMPLWQDSQ